jgi:PAS domain S-box-containing protein
VNLIVVLPAAMAAVSLFVALAHLLVYARGVRDRVHLIFAISCLGTCLYDACAAANYAAGEPAASAVWQRGEHVAICVVSAGLLWFVLAYTRQRLGWVLWAVTGYYAVELLLVLFLGGDWVLMARPLHKVVDLPWGGEVVYTEMQHGLLLHVESLVALATLVLSIALCVRFARRATGEDVQRSRHLLVALGVLALGGINDTAVSKGLYSFLYVIEYAYLGMILVMTYAMTSDVLGLARARAELDESHRRLRHIFEHVQDVYLETALDGTILALSPSAARWLGTAEGMRGRSALDLYADPAQRELLLGRLQEQGRVDDYEIDLRLPDGRVVRCAVSLALAEGRIVGSLRDITERKQAEEDRMQLERQLQHAQKLESLGVLAGGIAHDFNNLLTSILGSAELALLDLDGRHPVRERLAVIRDASVRASELCRQMLAYSGKGSFVVEPVDLSALVDGMRELLRVSVARRAALTSELGADLPTVRADATQLRQILLNLVINASEALGEAAGTVTIRTGVERCDRSVLRSGVLGEELSEGRYVWLEVLDTGCGMDEPTRARIFDPFFSTKFAGRGLGLASALGIVRSHRGTILVDSAPGRGSRFRVLLPAAEPAAAHVAAEPDSGSFRGQGLVLLVDDEPGVRTVARSMLERLGFEVRVAASGREGVQALRDDPQRFALAIVDLTMPDLGGVEVAGELWRDRPELPVILTSGYSIHEVSNRFVDDPRVGFLAKPFSWEALRGEVHAASSRQQTASA